MSAEAATPASKDVASLQVSLSQMLDLALGTPEVGAVNLNILHNFLGILLHQIDLKSMKVEYRGDDANRIKTMVSSLKSGPSFYFHEYSIVGVDEKGKQRPGDSSDMKVDVVTEGEDLMKTKGIKQKVSPGTEGEPETVIYVEPIIDGATPTALGFKRLDQSVNELRQRFQALEELATTPELVERVKGKVTDPVTDVWQTINITKRLDASEQGIDKLTKMVQDVMKGDTVATTGEDTSVLKNRLVHLETVLDNLNQIVQNLQVISDRAEENGEEILIGEEPSAPRENGQTGQRVSLSQLLGGIDVKQMHQDVANLQTEVTQIRTELHDLNEKIDQSKAELTQHITMEQQKQKDQEASRQQGHEAPSPEEGDKSSKVKEAEKKSETHGETSKETPKESPKGTVKSPPKDTHKDGPSSAHPETGSPKDATQAETIDSEELQLMEERITKLEKDVACLFEKVDCSQVAGASGTAELDDLVQRIQGIQGDMDKLHRTADRLIDDRANREMHLNALLEQVELLKTIKADREDLEDALADKADAQAINRKVSYDQFDAACDDLAQGLEDAISKLGKQESIWQQALDEVQREIEGKVDKIEMTPLRDFVTTRLKSLQDKVKSVAQMRQENEAAGTKKLLRDVQCISCDKNVIMKMEDAHKFKVDTLPCTSSIKPYLTYELDQVRKQHRRLPHSRNMIQFEAALQEEARKQKSAKTDTLVKTPRDHLCNRYCGGSHTVTTPQQRVMRMGHFLTQWGPEIIQLSEGLVKGSDGKMYKGRPMPGKFDICGPGYCDDRSEDARTSDHGKPHSQNTQVQQRKSNEKQVATNGNKKRTAKRHYRDISNEVIDEVDSPIEDSDTFDQGRTVRYDDNIDD